MTAPMTYTLPVTEVDGHPIDHAVFHAASQLPDHPHTAIFGVRRAADHAWAWVFLDNTDHTVREVTTWVCRTARVSGVNERVTVRGRQHWVDCPTCGQAQRRQRTDDDRWVITPHHIR